MTKQRLLEETAQILDNLVEEVLDFVQSLKQKHLPEKQETAISSEAVLAKEWLTPEDEAWQNL